MILKVLFGEKLTEINSNNGDNLLSLLNLHGWALQSDCGGNGTCGKCKVKLLNGNIENVQVDENGYILSCKAYLSEDVFVELEKAVFNNNLEFASNEVTCSNNSKNQRDVCSSDFSNKRENIKVEIDKNSIFSVALDIGTTTVCASLINQNTNVVCDRISVLNKQSMFGADVISRINACIKGNLHQLHNSIVKQVNSIIDFFKKEYSISSIDTVVVSANTTMLHIFCNISPDSIGFAPYTPVFLEKKTLEGKDLSVECKNIIILPSISSFVGADICSGIIFSELRLKNNLLVDLGTNGEIAYSKNGKIYCTSTAVGPAFEGACIDCGVGGISGAISKVFLENDSLRFNCIDNAPPSGICGAGLIDIIAILFNCDIIDFTGAFDSTSNSPLLKYLRDDKFYLTDSIYLSAKDIRQFQLAKSAICSGIQTLLDDIGEDEQNLDNIYLAGGVGYYMDSDNALAVGILPSSFNGKIKCIANSSLLGAELCIKNNSYIEDIVDVSRTAQTIELTNNPAFSQRYMMNMCFGEM